MLNFIKRYWWLVGLHLLGFVLVNTATTWSNLGFVVWALTGVALFVLGVLAFIKERPKSRNEGGLLIPDDFPEEYKPYVFTVLDRTRWGEIAYHSGLAVADPDSALYVNDLERQRRSLGRHAHGSGGAGMAILRAGYVINRAQKYKKEARQVFNQQGIYVVGNTFYRVPILGDFIATEIGPEIGFWIPQGLRFEDFEKASASVAEYLKVEKVVFYQDVIARKSGTVWMRIVLNDPLEESVKSSSYAMFGGWKLQAGKKEDGATAYIGIANNSGMVVGGVPGSGKSAALTGLLYPLIYNPDIEFTVIDGKNGTDWKWIEPRATHYISEEDSLEQVVQVLTEIDNERQIRNKAIYESRGTSNFWTEGPDKEFPLKIVVIDEVQMYLDPNQYLKHEKENREKVQNIASLVGKLIRLGRSTGIFVILATQKPTSDSIPTAIRDNTGIKVAFRVDTDDAAVAILGDGIRGQDITPVNIPSERRGQAVMKLEEGKFEVLRFAYISTEEAEQNVKGYIALTK